jgi:hypothetical protein
VLSGYNLKSGIMRVLSFKFKVVFHPKIPIFVIFKKTKNAVFIAFFITIRKIQQKNEGMRLVILIYAKTLKTAFLKWTLVKY